MKYLLVVGDGMADYPVPELDGKTPLQVAYKPNLDALAAKGKNGLVKTVPDGMNPGSETAILSLLGYDPRLYCTGRGPLEAPARGITLGEADAAFRCNLITEKDGVLVDYSAGHITTPEAKQLIEAVEKAFGKPGEIEFYPGLDYRHFLILRNVPSARQIECTPPHDASGAEISMVLPRANSVEVEETVATLKTMILQSKDVLASHPVNVARVNAGKRPANMIWPWGGGPKPLMPTFKALYGLNAAVISAVDLVKGIGKYAGMDVITVEGATGLADTNYEGKADAALKALTTHDFVFVHVEAPDEAGHVKDPALKVKTIEDLDRRVLGRILHGLKDPVAVAVLPDHPTPITVGTHTRDPVPFTIYTPNSAGDGVERFDESSAAKGSYGLVTQQSLMSLFVSSTTKPN
ncbi:MAG: cofactor-independent phosphoglycerate mutase [Candidatus Bathyarchaeota archaeon]|nr:cofactor-independent phosphoglycerate mutase [Candidatus Bathyarchaeota archaeon]